MKIDEMDIISITPEVVFEMDGRARKARYTGNMILIVNYKSADVARSYAASAVDAGIAVEVVTSLAEEEETEGPE